MFKCSEDTIHDSSWMKISQSEKFKAYKNVNKIYKTISGRSLDNCVD